MSVCYKCGAAAAGACTNCGQFHCPAHGNKTAGDGVLTMARHGLCDACHADMGFKKGIAALIGVLAIGTILVIWFIANVLNKQ